MSIGIGLRFEVLKMALKHVKPDDAVAAARDYLEFVVHGPSVDTPEPNFIQADNMDELMELLSLRTGKKVN